MRKPVTVYYPGGRASFSPDFIRSFGSLEKIKESDVLKRISCRDKVLEALWEESNPGTEKAAQKVGNETEN